MEFELRKWRNSDAESVAKYAKDNNFVSYFFANYVVKIRISEY